MKVKITMYKVLLTQINDETSKYLFACETISKVSQIMMVGFRFVSFYNQLEWAQKFSINYICSSAHKHNGLGYPVCFQLHMWRLLLLGARTTAGSTGAMRLVEGYSNLNIYC